MGDLYIFGLDMQLNGAFTNLGDCLAIIVGVPIIEGCLFPLLERKRGRRISRKSKFITGFSFAILANASAVLVELLRRQRPFIEGDKGISKCAPPVEPPIHMSDISCLYAFIPMILTGIAEILVNPVVYQLAFDEAPKQLMSVVHAFNLVVAGSFSNCITGPLSNLIFPQNSNMPSGPHWNQGNGTCTGPECRAAGGCGGAPGDTSGCGDVNLTFYVNMAIGAVCLALYLIVDKIQLSNGSLKPEDLEIRDGDEERHSASFVALGERDAIQR